MHSSSSKSFAGFLNARRAYGPERMKSLVLTIMLQSQKLQISAAVMFIGVSIFLLIYVIKEGSLNQVPVLTEVKVQEGKSITVVPGQTITSIALDLASKTSLSTEKFLTFAFKEKILNSLGIKSVSMEGYIFPGTYKLREKDPIPEFLTNTTNVRRSIAARYNPKRDDHGITLHDALIIATFAARQKASSIDDFIRNVIIRNDQGKLYDLPIFKEYLKKLESEGLESKMLPTTLTPIGSPNLEMLDKVFAISKQISKSAGYTAIAGNSTPVP